MILQIDVLQNSNIILLLYFNKEINYIELLVKRKQKMLILK